MSLEFAADCMNLLVEVTWDRCTRTEAGDVTAYGWLPRDDGRSDFVLLFVTASEAVGFTTSSAALSHTFSERLFGSCDGHKDCERVEHVFGALVARSVHLAG